MLDQLSSLIEKFGDESVVKNDSVPNEQNKEVMNEASTTIMEGLKGVVAEGKISELAKLFQGGSTDDSNPVVKQISGKLVGNLGEKFGLSQETSAGIASSLIPKVLSALIGNAKDPNHKGFEISDIISAISGGKESSGIMDTVSKFGAQFGLEQNDDKESTSKKPDREGGILDKIFGD